MFKFWSEIKRQKIKIAAELPDWFSPDKYKPLSKLDTYGWYSQLFVRQQIFAYLKTGYGRQNKHERLNELIEQLRANPIFEIKSGSFAYALLGGKYSAINSEDIHDRAMTLAVSPLTASRFYHLDYRVMSDRRKTATDFYKISFSDGDLEAYIEGMHNGTWPPSWFHQTILESAPAWQGQGRAFAEIDLLMPTEVILSHFEVFLRLEKRKYTSSLPKERHRATSLEKLYRLGIVAYLDLQLWAALNHKSIPMRIMADAIFPNKNEGEEVVRKTVEPLANKIIEWPSKVIEALEAEAIAEKAEKI